MSVPRLTLGEEGITQPRRKRRSKRQVLKGLPPSWREQLCARGSRGRYADALLASALTGARPGELLKGITTWLQLDEELGIPTLCFHVHGLKVKERQGQRFRFEEGQPYSLLGVVEDIGDQRRLRDLERAREAAEAASVAKNEFLSRMSHELRTPLNAMLGFAQLLSLEGQPSLSPRQNEWTHQIQQAGWHLLEMINDTLDLSRIESGAMRLSLDRQDLPAQLQEVSALLQAQWQQQGVRIELRLAASARWVQADATRLKQVLSNLLSNAIKYNRPGGEVRISSEAVAAGQIEIRVQDQGPGLSPAQQAQLFQPFNRLGQENGRIEGTGIGLVISRRLAELMGGSLDFEAPAGSSGGPDGGACFVLRLPAAEGPQATAHELPAIARRSYARQAELLYIEDNPVNAELMLAMLAQRPSLHCELRADGRSGLQALRSRRPDLLLLDMQLPDMDGLDVLRQLRQEPGLAELPVLVVSANALPEQQAAAQALGVQAYLTKPLDLQTLLAQLDTLFDDGTAR